MPHWKEPFANCALDLACGCLLDYFSLVSVQELESEVARLSKPDLDAFTRWFEDFVADSWDKQIEADIAKGKLDHLGKQADAQFEAGRCTPL
jgi:hypothetical protein